MPRFLDKDEALGWIREHGQRVNAGDAAPILYESPYDNPYQLWLRKTGKSPPKEQTEAMASGNITEAAIFAWYEQVARLAGGRTQVWAAYDEDMLWVQGKADYWHPGSGHLAEFKSPFRDDSKDHEIAKGGQIPYHYWLQCQHLIQVFDAKSMDFVSWRSADDYAIVPVHRDDDYWLAYMLPAYCEFQRRVTENAWPKPEGEVYERSEQWQMHARRLLECKSLCREYETLYDREAAAIKRLAAASGRKTIIGGGIRGTWTTLKPRWEVAIKADSEEAQAAILKALEPLEGRKGVGKITKRSYPPNLVLKISVDNTKEDEDSDTEEDENSN